MFDLVLALVPIIAVLALLGIAFPITMNFAQRRERGARK